MAKASRRNLARTMVRLLNQQPDRKQALVRSLAAYLVTHKQTHQLDLFMKDLARELQLSGQQLTAEVQSAYPLDEATRAQLKEYLEHATGTTQVELEETVDAGLLSGMVVRTADQELDITARRQLQRLTSLNSGGNS
jgi:F0F1-type ATP synthase delta subunit